VADDILLLANIAVLMQKPFSYERREYEITGKVSEPVAATITGESFRPWCLL
jgi:hypothetical protein